MTLRRRLVFTSLVAALAAATVLDFAVGALRTRDRTLALDQVLGALLTDANRARCEADPTYFPLGAPNGVDTQAKPGADTDLPPERRQFMEQHPFRIFVYDESYRGGNFDAPRFPEDLRAALRSSSVAATSTYVSPAGTGLQMAMHTHWVGSNGAPCAVLLARMQPGPNETSEHVVLFLELFAGSLVVALFVAGPTMERIRRMGMAARHSAAGDYKDLIPVSGKDEVSALAFAVNEAGTGIRRRMIEARERDEAFARFAATVRKDVAVPLMEQAAQPSASATADLAARLFNLSSTVRLRTRDHAREPVALLPIVTRVVDRYQGMARAAGVTLTTNAGTPLVAAVGDGPLIEQAIGNLIDNGIRYNRAGGRVTVTLESRASGAQFALRVVDDGPGVGADNVERLNKGHRFRGDEDETRREGGPGLGLAIVNEVSGRFEWQLMFSRPTGGGFQAEIVGKTKTEP